MPEGFVYEPAFLSLDEHEHLRQRIRLIEFGEVRMHGVIARRRVKHFGWTYGYESWDIVPAAPIPDFLLPLRERVGAFAGIKAALFEEVLMTEYPPGAGIGWHRDAPMFGTVVGISLLSVSELRLRPGSKGRTEMRQVLDPGSAYILRDEIRQHWRHSLPPAKALRFSVTFRTLRRK
jgi:DNA oxidative demethylase